MILHFLAATTTTPLSPASVSTSPAGSIPGVSSASLPFFFVFFRSPPAGNAGVPLETIERMESAAVACRITVRERWIKDNSGALCKWRLLDVPGPSRPVTDLE
ncbi:hypothetical protein MGG_17201 [Pyricularia oryzae 70-15]|uniref:Uncharacterized protein n=1 Tax=Pyricularia oryzae (strain 70-15 / ATCC MYA-4617 / FGSC 8958) TaxID=242507 RepID=G4N8E1_PYRO7|nr:uncharacterized protein MGG_17201 [Pyricularia oryzae 70-15]EHA50990.1 hypothetical protein MGG_17201 [Pyricularia oryzae 70-15]